MINLFLDAQIWLDLYYFSANDLTQFTKLKDLLGTDINLFVTEQLKNEVKRNRENKIKSALSQFSEFKFQIPNLAQGYAKYDELFDEIKKIKITHKELLKEIKEATNKEELVADKLIQECFSKAKDIPYSSTVIEAAVLRYKLGNPPGKENSYGDAINWLSLQEAIPDKEDLFFVSYDKDFRSPIDDKNMDSFLVHEWEQRKQSKIFFYTDLTSFLREHIKDIELKNETTKNLLIEDLRKSGQFSTTHNLISKLDTYESWTEDQVISLFKAADNNNQVWSISGDADVYRFFRKLFAMHKDSLIQISELSWILQRFDCITQPASEVKSTEN